MRSVWQELKAFTDARQVDSATIRTLRRYLVEHWNTPAKQVPLVRA
jgi:hypothetical protein